MKGHWKVWRGGITLNEGDTPVNFTLTWGSGWFVYFYFFGRRWHT